MIIDNALLDRLTAEAKASPRLRMNMDLRNSASDSSQRMLNAIEPGSVVPVHRHRAPSETLVVLWGRVGEEYSSSEGEVVAEFELVAGGGCHVAGDLHNDVPVACALNIPAGQWHSLRALDPGTVILEMKDGPYEPIQECDILK